MAKTNRRQLEFEAWNRRLQSALVNVEGAASLWGGCDSEAMDYSDLDDPRRRFVLAMEGETEEENRISQRLWDLAQDMAQAIERGKETMKMLITNLGINPVSETMAKACNEHETDEGECWAEQLNIGCPFSSDDFEAVSCDEIKPEHWREVFEGEDKPEEKETGSWKVGDIVEVKNERDGKWYPGKILLIDNTSVPFFVQSEFGFKEVSKLTRCLWCSEDQLRRLEEPEPELEFKFGDKVTVTDLTSFQGIFNAYTEHGKAYILKEGEYACSAEFVSTIKAGWE